MPNRPAHDLTAPDARSLEAGDEWATRSIGTLPFPLGEHDLVRDVTSGDQRDRRDRRDAVGAFAGPSKVRSAAPSNQALRLDMNSVARTKRREVAVVLVIGSLKAGLVVGDRVDDQREDPTLPR